MDRRAEQYSQVHELDWFSDKEAKRMSALKEIPRYGAIINMTHRTNIGLHSLRVSNLAALYCEMLETAGVSVDRRKAYFMADHHDDAEIITGDIPTPVKQNATPEQKRQIEEEEIAAVLLQEGTFTYHPGFSSFYPEIYNEYRQKQTIEARIVNYADKSDGLHEAVHEVVCGDYPEVFKPVIKAYQPAFEKLINDNQDWMSIIEGIIGNPCFEFPKSDKLIAVKPDILDYRSVNLMITSIARGKSSSYLFWLGAAQSVFKAGFLKDVFPGWRNKLPDRIESYANLADQGLPFGLRNIGLTLPSGSKDNAEQFVTSLTQDKFRNILLRRSLEYGLALPENQHCQAELIEKYMTEHLVV